jgi:hypothetical protein
MTRLEELLDGVGESFEFATWEVLPPLVPGLDVEGVGNIGSPVTPVNARHLIAAAEQAPYGRGEDTIVDTSVRRVWQIEPGRFTLRNPAWEAQIGAMVKSIAGRFDIVGDVRAVLYKLLIYEPGSFFVPHRDTEKIPGMFATLVVCLPSHHEGGTLVVEHENRTARIEFGGSDSEFRSAYAAFYADCRHEITPVISGYRVCLVYNLTLDHASLLPCAPQSARTVDETAELLRELLSQPEHGPKMLAVPLEHRYTKASLAPSALKGADRARADILARAANSLDYDCFLALLTHHQQGVPEIPEWNYRSRRNYGEEEFGDEDDGDFEDGVDAEMEEVFEEELTLATWRDMQGRERPLGEIRLELEELLWQEDRDGWSVRSELQEATGNEGATLDRWYRTGVMVIWPRARFYRILAAQGQATALPELERMADGAADAETLAACREFALTVLEVWQTRQWAEGPHSSLDRMFRVLEQVGTVELACYFVREVLRRCYTGSQGAALRRLCERFGWDALRRDLKHLIRRPEPANGPIDTKRLLALMAPLYESPATWTEERRSACRSLARSIAVMLDGDRTAPAKTPFSGYGYETEQQSPVAGAVRIFGSVSNQKPLNRWLDRALDRKQGCGIHEVLGPDLKAIAGWLPEVPAARPAYVRVREHCLAQLGAATAAMPQPPADWRRAAEVRCKCADCAALAQFLANPAIHTARFPLAEARRRHLHSEIDVQRLDCTHTTERRGRPFTLICVKTTAAYQREKQRYEQDCRLLEEIRGLPDG